MVTINHSDIVSKGSGYKKLKMVQRQFQKETLIFFKIYRKKTITNPLTTNWKLDPNLIRWNMLY
jgi:hypothetical protein